MLRFFRRSRDPNDGLQCGSFSLSLLCKLKTQKKKVICSFLLIYLIIVYGNTFVHICREFIFRMNYDAKTVGNEVTPGVSTDAGVIKIPKIIHQVFFNISKRQISENFMLKYNSFRQSWVDLNPDHEYILWNKTMIIELIKEHYPQVKQTFDKYVWTSQIDIARFLVVNHMGGVYADIDIKCRRSLSNFYQEAGDKTVILQPAHTPFGFKNDFFAASKNHAFTTHVIAGLRHADVAYITSYIGVIMRTGPMFLLGRYLNYPFKKQIYKISRESVKLQVHREHAGSWHESDGYVIIKIANFIEKWYTFIKIIGMLIVTILILRVISR